MNNNTNTSSVLINLDSLIHAVKMSDNDFLNSVQRAAKLATAAITKSVLKQALLEDDFSPFNWDPQKVASQRQTIDYELATIIVKVRKSFIWLNSQVKQITGKRFINVFLNADEDETILNVCSDFIGEINMRLTFAQEGIQSEI